MHFWGVQIDRRLNFHDVMKQKKLIEISEVYQNAR